MDGLITLFTLLVGSALGGLFILIAVYFIWNLIGNSIADQDIWKVWVIGSVLCLLTILVYIANIF